MITYKKIDNKELKELYDYATPIWNECYSEMIPSEQIELLCHKYFDYENIEKYQKDGMIYVYIYYNKERAGFIAYQVNDDHVYLDKLYLQKEYRGMHISSNAFDNLMSLYNKDIVLNVNQHNERGLRAYLGKDFKIVETITYDLGNGLYNNDYIMRKTNNFVKK